MGDVEDPYLYAAFPLHDWQQTEMGKWVMEHAVNEPSFMCYPDQRSMGYRVVITGELSEQDHTYFVLKWGKHRES